MTRRYVFTADTGRCGEAYLSRLLRRHVSNCYVAWEEPQVDLVLPGVLGDLERRFRRRFVETDELLGRRGVLRAYDDGDDDYLIRVARRRLATIERTMTRLGAEVYIDVSKFFVRGLHIGFRALLSPFALLLLVRDPVENMCSYLNRDKRFNRDSGLPDGARNILRLDSATMSKGELYLWAWCETYLRYRRLIDEGAADRCAEIRTERLDDTAYVDDALDRLGLSHSPVTRGEPVNTNVEGGYAATVVRDEDLITFERFIARVPGDLLRQIPYLDGYDPYRLYRNADPGTEAKGAP